MKEPEIVSAVQDTTGLSSEDAEQAIRATLRVLGMRLAGRESAHLAAQLPGTLAGELPEQGGAERFGVDEFYTRMAENEEAGGTPQEARRRARAVMVALQQGITPGEFDDVVAQLPEEYEDLLGTESVQHH